MFDELNYMDKREIWGITIIGQLLRDTRGVDRDKQDQVGRAIRP